MGDEDMDVLAAAILTTMNLETREPGSVVARFEGVLKELLEKGGVKAIRAKLSDGKSGN